MRTIDKRRDNSFSFHEIFSPPQFLHHRLAQHPKKKRLSSLSVFKRQCVFSGRNFKLSPLSRIDDCPSALSPSIFGVGEGGTGCHDLNPFRRRSRCLVTLTHVLESTRIKTQPQVNPDERLEKGGCTSSSPSSWKKYISLSLSVEKRVIIFQFWISRFSVLYSKRRLCTRTWPPRFLCLFEFSPRSKTMQLRTSCWKASRGPMRQVTTAT